MNKTVYDTRCNIFIVVFSFICLLLFLFFSPLFAENTPSKPFENYNVVLIFIDTLRADHLSCYGYPRKTSPNIDRLAKESFVFEQNFTPITFTLASFMSIITSLYPNSHAVLDIDKDKLSARVYTLAQILQMYGYKTAWFGPLKDPHLSPEAGFGRGFDQLVEYSYNYPPLEQWLDMNKDKRFFLNFHTYKVHDPYGPDQKYKEKFTKIKSMAGVIEDYNQYEWGTVEQAMKNKELATEIVGEELFNQFVAAGVSNADAKQVENFFVSRKKLDKISWIRTSVYWRGINLSDNSVNAYIQSLYDATILQYDQEVIGPLLDKLKALGLYDKTIIIICADHGEEFYEHGGHGHGSTLYDEVTHVPLIIRIPWVKHGKRIKELTQTVDILPTVLDLLEIPLPHQAQGKSLVCLINNKKFSPPRDYIFGRFRDKVSSIRSKEWLLLLYNNIPGTIDLYHLPSDPKEQKSAYFNNQGIALKLVSELKEWEAFLPSYKDKDYFFPVEMDETTRERIRKTGYW
jgi:arylsulfatase A-like enzyme